MPSPALRPEGDIFVSYAKTGRPLASKLVAMLEAEGGSGRGQMQQILAGKFILNLLLRSHHSITSSARASRVGGTSRPSALAVFKLITSSNFVGRITGKSVGLIPCKILPV